MLDLFKIEVKIEDNRSWHIYLYLRYSNNDSDYYRDFIQLEIGARFLIWK